MNYFHVVILALVQGAAELLPVSSSAHVILAQRALGLDPASPDMVFLLVMLHTGTMGAVLLYFRHRWAKLLKGGWVRLGVLLTIATGATGVLGLALKYVVEHYILGGGSAEVEDLFRSPVAVASALTAAGLLILVSGIFSKLRGEKHDDRGEDLGIITNGRALIIGLVQGVCLPFRGFSRSGATISTALFLGMPHRIAEDFSFLLAVVVTPPVILRSVYKLAKAMDRTGTSLDYVLHHTVLPGFAGAFFAFLSGYLALKLLSRMLEGGRWWIFGPYCFFVAAVTLFY